MKHVILVIGALVAVARPAHAELFGQADDVARDVAETAVDRVRRSIAIGPEVGSFGGVTADGDGQLGVSFGLALYRFHMPPLEERLVAAVRERARSRLSELLETGRFKDLRSVPDEVLEEVRREAAQAIQPRLLERPRMKVVVEGAVLQQGGFQARALVGLGLGYTTLGLSAGVQHDDMTTMMIGGPELSLMVTPFGRVRTPVIDLFTRADFGAGDGTRTVTFVGGARLAFDVL